MLLYQLDQLDEPKLQQVCNDLTSESLTLEFKRELLGKDIEDKVEFLKDVAALANTDGGDLVYGIEEKSGTAHRIHPIKVTSIDAEKRRLGQILDGGVEPRIPGARFHEIPVKDGFVLVLRIPQSFDGPHRISYNNGESFFLRSGTHISKMRYDQLKNAFDRTATLAERSNGFRRERLEAIKLGQTPKPVIAGPLCVAHIIPLVSFTGRQPIDVVGLNSNPNAISFREWGNTTWSLNLDGLVTHGIDKSTPGTYGYNQIYRTGCTESVFLGGVSDANDKSIPSAYITINLRMAIERNLKFLKQSGLSGPIVVGIAMLNVEGYVLSVGGTFNFLHDASADRNSIIIPEAWIDSLDTLSDIDEVVKPMMDILWQSFGVHKCFNYTDEGKWNPPRM